MLTIVVGAPGAGKSLKAVKDYIIKSAAGVPAVDARIGIKERPAILGRHVVTNVEIIIDRIEADYPETIGKLHYVETPMLGDRPFADLDRLVTWAKEMVVTGPDGTKIGVQLVIDEAQLQYRKGNWKPGSRVGVDPDVLNWYTKHRHQGVDIVLLTQRVGQIEPQLVGLAEAYIVLKRSAMIGLGKDKYREWLYDAYKGNEVYRKDNLKHDKRFFRYYRSHDDGKIAEQRPKTKSFFLQWRFAWVYVVLVGGLGYMLFHWLPSAWDRFGPGEEPIPVVEEAFVDAPMSAPLTVATPLRPTSSLEAPALNAPVASVTDKWFDHLAVPPIAGAPAAPQWAVTGWIVYSKDGKLVCSARFQEDGKVVKPAMMIRLRGWKSVEATYDEEDDTCTLTIVEDEDKDPIVEVAEF